MLKIQKLNLLLASISLVLIVTGYYLLAQGSITVAPVFLTLGYLVFVPLAIIL